MASPCGHDTAGREPMRRIHRLDELKGYTFRDLIMMANMGRVGMQHIVKLAAERGIQIK
jgi:hypothetical protein